MCEGGPFWYNAVWSSTSRWCGQSSWSTFHHRITEHRSHSRSEKYVTSSWFLFLFLHLIFFPTITQNVYVYVHIYVKKKLFHCIFYRRSKDIAANSNEGSGNTVQKLKLWKVLEFDVKSEVQTVYVMMYLYCSCLLVICSVLLDDFFAVICICTEYVT